jgi:hypothetical protein
MWTSVILDRGSIGSIVRTGACATTVVHDRSRIGSGCRCVHKVGVHAPMQSRPITYSKLVPNLSRCIGGSLSGLAATLSLGVRCSGGSDGTLHYTPFP